ncbi:MAG: ABC transporter permease [Arcobacteraceae bacterium]|nr:ABC transporter permease [Arcobacteraceae bacterium]
MYQSIKALKANRLKTLLIYLSLTFSISAIFLITSISNGVISMYSSILKSDGDIIVTQARISDTFFSNVDINIISKINEIHNVKKTSAIIVGATPIEHLPIVAVYGVSNNRFENYSLLSGIYPKSNEVLIGNSLRESLQNKDFIAIANKKFKVSGTFESDIGFENGGIVLNIEDAGMIFNKSASMIMINTAIEADTNKIIENVKLLSEDIEVKSTTSFVENYNQFKIIKISANVISVVAFCMGLLGVISIMSLTIHQRQSEFGIKRAIGIPMRRIVLQIIQESSVLGLFSFVSAFFISNIILYFIKNSTLLQGYVNGELTLSLTLYIFITTMLMVTVGAVLPALNASKTDPVILIQGSKI